MSTEKSTYSGRSHIEAIRREVTRLEFMLMGEDGEPDPISCHRVLGNIVAQADAITIIVEDIGR